MIKCYPLVTLVTPCSGLGSSTLVVAVYQREENLETSRVIDQLHCPDLHGLPHWRAVPRNERSKPVFEHVSMKGSPDPRVHENRECFSKSGGRWHAREVFRLV